MKGLSTILRIITFLVLLAIAGVAVVIGVMLTIGSAALGSEGNYSFPLLTFLSVGTSMILIIGGIIFLVHAILVLANGKALAKGRGRGFLIYFLLISAALTVFGAITAFSGDNTENRTAVLVVCGVGAIGILYALTGLAYCGKQRKSGFGLEKIGFGGFLRALGGVQGFCSLILAALAVLVFAVIGTWAEIITSNSSWSSGLDDGKLMIIGLALAAVLLIYGLLPFIAGARSKRGKGGGVLILNLLLSVGLCVMFFLVGSKSGSEITKIVVLGIDLAFLIACAVCAVGALYSIFALLSLPRIKKRMTVTAHNERYSGRVATRGYGEPDRYSREGYSRGGDYYAAPRSRR